MMDGVGRVMRGGCVAAGVLALATGCLVRNPQWQDDLSIDSEKMDVGSVDPSMTSTSGATASTTSSVQTTGQTSGSELDLPSSNTGGDDCVVRVYADEHTTCALDDGGAVQCWGRNNYGQVGNDDLGQEAVRDPTRVVGLGPDPIRMMAMGAFHVVTRTDTARFGWGLNEDGEIDISDGTISIPAAVPMVGGSFDLVDAGGFHTCVASGGLLECFGRNADGQCGVAAAGAVGPSTVDGIANVTAIATGGFHTCVVSDGEVYCWGRNVDFELGRDGAGASTPSVVTGLSGLGVEELKSGDWHACARAGGDVYCWGRNEEGQLGVDTAGVDQADPQQVPLPDPVVELIVGDDHNCARTDADEVYCWGVNRNGDIGVDPGTSMVGPVLVEGTPGGIVNMAAARAHTCVGTDQGQVWCWGSNNFGQLGVEGGSGPRPLPADYACE